MGVPASNAAAMSTGCSGFIGRPLGTLAMTSLQVLPVDLAHHDVQRADDGWDVGDQAAAAQFVGDREVAERTAAGADSPGDRAAVADDHEAHLAAGGFGF